jgi:hypothetical protein
MRLRQDTSQTKLSNALRQELENLLRTEPCACLNSLEFLRATKNPAADEAVIFVGDLISGLQGLEPKPRAAVQYRPKFETRGNV